jgi:hypothetical protein
MKEKLVNYFQWEMLELALMESSNFYWRTRYIMTNLGNQWGEMDEG